MNCSRFIILILFVFHTALLSAQSFGVKAGLNLASTNVELLGTNIELDPVLGLLFGGVAEFNFSEKVALETNLLFIQSGWADNVNNERNILNNIQVPIHVKYYIELNEGFDLILFGGPYFGYAFSGKIKTEDASEDFDFDEQERNQFDFGLNYGIGFQINDDIQVAAAYSSGLLNLDNSEESDDPLENILKYRNTALQLSATYFFQR